MGDGLAGGDVLHHDSSSGGRGRVNSDGDGLSRRDGEVVEVNSEVGEPFEPGLVRDTAVGDGEVDTRLENRVLSGVTVDTDPGRGSAVAAWGGDDEGTGDGGEGLSRRWGSEDGAGPVGAELGVGVVCGDGGCLEDLVGVGADEGARAACARGDALLEAGWARDGEVGEEEGKGDGDRGELHDFNAVI